VIKISKKLRIEDFDSIDKYIDATLFEVRKELREEREH
jgi:hypothetical protein